MLFRSPHDETAGMPSQTKAVVPLAEQADLTIETQQARPSPSAQIPRQLPTPSPSLASISSSESGSTSPPGHQTGSSTSISSAKPRMTRRRKVVASDATAPAAAGPSSAPVNADQTKQNVSSAKANGSQPPATTRLTRARALAALNDTTDSVDDTEMKGLSFSRRSLTPTSVVAKRPKLLAKYDHILAELPVVNIPALPALSEHTFTREELAEKLGGNTTDTVVQ